MRTECFSWVDCVEQSVKHMQCQFPPWMNLICFQSSVGVTVLRCPSLFPSVRDFRFPRAGPHKVGFMACQWASAPAAQTSTTQLMSGRLNRDEVCQVIPKDAVLYSRLGSFEVAEAEGVQRGTKIVVHLKGDCYDFAKEDKIKGIWPGFQFTWISWGVGGEGGRMWGGPAGGYVRTWQQLQLRQPAQIPPRLSGLASLTVFMSDLPATS